MLLISRNFNLVVTVVFLFVFLCLMNSSVSADHFTSAEQVSVGLLEKFKNKTQQGQNYLTKTEKNRQEFYSDVKRYVDENKENWCAEVDRSVNTAKNKTRQYITENQDNWAKKMKQLREKISKFFK